MMMSMNILGKRGVFITGAFLSASFGELGSAPNRNHFAVDGRRLSLRNRNGSTEWKMEFDDSVEKTDTNIHLHFESCLSYMDHSAGDAFFYMKYSNGKQVEERAMTLNTKQDLKNLKKALEAENMDCFSPALQKKSVQSKQDLINDLRLTTDSDKFGHHGFAFIDTETNPDVVPKSVRYLMDMPEKAAAKRAGLAGTSLSESLAFENDDERMKVRDFFVKSHKARRLFLLLDHFRKSDYQMSTNENASKAEDSVRGLVFPGEDWSDAIFLGSVVRDETYGGHLFRDSSVHVDYRLGMPASDMFNLAAGSFQNFLTRLLVKSETADEHTQMVKCTILNFLKTASITAKWMSSIDRTPAMWKSRWQKVLGEDSKLLRLITQKESEVLNFWEPIHGDLDLGFWPSINPKKESDTGKGKRGIDIKRGEADESSRRWAVDDVNGKAMKVFLSGHVPHTAVRREIEKNTIDRISQEIRFLVLKKKESPDFAEVACAIELFSANNETFGDEDEFYSAGTRFRICKSVLKDELVKKKDLTMKSFRNILEEKIRLRKMRDEDFRQLLQERKRQREQLWHNRLWNICDKCLGGYLSHRALVQRSHRALVAN